MSNLIEYLKFVKESIKNHKDFKSIHIVLGNESCDIDSSVSAVLLAYLLNTKKDDFFDEETLVIPIQNVTKEVFLYRTENCHLYEEIGISLDLLVYREELNFEELIKTKKMTTTLVDHHVLTQKDKILESTVVQIFDHRPREPGCCWNEDKISLNINEVGSCCTLIADQILCSAEDILCKELAYLLYAAIVCDCKALKAECGKAKQLDYKIVENLESKFDFLDTREELFKKIVKYHKKVSHLSPRQILLKDTKIIENIPVPSLPMLAEDFLNLEGAYEALVQFSEETNTSLIVLKGGGSGRKDLAIFCRKGEEGIRDKVLDGLYNSEKHNSYSFNLSEISTEIPGIKLLNQGNLLLSRKQLVPIIKDSVLTINKIQ